MKRFMNVAIFVLALSFGAAVFAQDPQGQPGGAGRRNREKRMKQLDVNNDGAISRDEWKGKSEVFDRIDKNRDGSLSRDELSGAPRPGSRVNQMDTNKDNQISRDEWKGNPRRFGRLDVNSDGVITKEELRSVRRNRR